ncbi:uncharacterized protein LOC119954502 [Scyliorhinus canicula]|uniref:uncharacterized protein LOC119954502 n=1 Tax=Scyliorhinus canicula TaxID=7830 RepID=UPI0018F5EE0B|nr:uncharacterized protein LOC119954502 [Scyliorhinus canicula]
METYRFMETNDIKEFGDSAVSPKFHPKHVFQEDECGELGFYLGRKNPAGSIIIKPGFVGAKQTSNTMPGYDPFELSIANFAVINNNRFLEISGSMFHNAAQNIAKELDPYGTLIPAVSLCDAEKYKPLHLVKIEKGFLFFTKDKYFPTSVTLADILTDGKDLDFEVFSLPVCHYGGDDSIGGSAGVAIDVCKHGVGAGISGGVSETMTTVGMKKRAINQNTLHRVTRGSKVDRKHWFVRNLPDNTIYIIIEVIETDGPCNLKKIASGKSHVKVGAGFAASTKQSLTCPTGTPVAFKILKLHIADTILDVYCQTLSLIVSNSSPKNQLTGLAKLSDGTKLIFLQTFLEILGSCDNLPDLAIMLYQMHEGLQPDLQVLNKMEDKDRASIEKLLDLLGIRMADPSEQPLTLTPQQNGIIETVATLNQSLNVLHPDTVTQLATSIEMKILPIQLKLMAKIEERCLKSRNFINQLDPAANVQETEESLETLVLQLTDEEFEVTHDILEDFGFLLKRETASISYDIDSDLHDLFHHIFVALYILSTIAT